MDIPKAPKTAASIMKITLNTWRQDLGCNWVLQRRQLP